MNEPSGSYLAPALAQLAALAVDGNITRAAQRTGTSQPTLSRSLKAWEEDLGVTLLIRHGRRVELTDEGRILATAAASSLHTLDQALGRIRGSIHEPPLTVGFLRSLGPTVAGDLIASFLVSRPKTVIVHREGSSTDLLDGLDESRIDVAITSPKPPDRFSWLAIGEQALVLVVPSGHRLAKATTTSLTEVRDDPFLSLDPRFDARQRSDALCAAAGFMPRIVLEADDFLTIRGYVATGMGVALLPADASLSPRTVSIPLSDPNAHRVFGLAWDPSKVMPATGALIAHTKDLAEKYPGWADILA